MKKIVSLFILGLFCFSCSHIRMKYTAKYRVEEAGSITEGQFVYNNSYKVGGWQIACIITGILYGGACWGYLGLPTNEHKKQIENDAKLSLASELQTSQYLIWASDVTRTSWSAGEPKAELLAMQKNSSLQEKTPRNQTPVKKMQKSEEPAEEVDGFLR